MRVYEYRTISRGLSEYIPVRFKDPFTKKVQQLPLVKLKNGRKRKCLYLSKIRKVYAKNEIIARYTILNLLSKNTPGFVLLNSKGVY